MLLILGLPSCVKRDLDSLCQVAKDILAEPRIVAAQRMEKLLEQSSPHSEAVKAWHRQAPAIVATKRYEALRQAGAAEGLTDWRCGALEQLLAPTAKGQQSAKP
jgi:hypothetical protein